MRFTAAVSGFIRTMPPLRRRGERGKVDMDYVLSYLSVIFNIMRVTTTSSGLINYIYIYQTIAVPVSVGLGNGAEGKGGGAGQ